MPDEEPVLDFPPRVPPGPDPAREFAGLRERCPVAPVRLPDGRGAWLVTRYADNQSLFTDPRLSRAAAAAAGAPRVRGTALEAASITTMDPPEHTRLRRLVAGEFTGRRVARQRPRIQRIAEELADRMAAEGCPADLVAGFAQPLPIRVICMLLGIRDADRGRFAAWTDTYLATTGATPAEVERAAGLLHGYIGELVARRRAEPSADLLGELAAAGDEGRLSDEEIVAFGVTLLVAGYQTVSSLIAGTVQTLLEHPGQLAALRADPGLLPGAVEEALRYVAVSAGGGTIRIATEELKLGGTRIRVGEAVLPATTSANRDPATFPDPDRFDVRRDPNPHLAFGYGVHRCLGAALARTELEIALRTLLDRFPGLRPADPAQAPDWHTGRMIRGPVTLPVAW